MRDHEHGGEQHGQDLDPERRGPAHGEQGRTDRRPGQLVERDEPGLEPRLADAEVALVHEHRHQRPGRGVDEHLGRADQEQGSQHHSDVDDAGEDRRAERDQYDGAEQVGDDDEAEPVDAVGDRAGVETEQQPRQLLEQHRHRDQRR